MCGRKTKPLLFLSLIFNLSTSGQAATFEVNNLNDSGLGSLRSAIIQANISPGPDAIEFAPGVVGTIALSSSLPLLEESLTLTGPGRQLLVIDGGNQFSGLVDTDMPAQPVNLTVNDITLLDFDDPNLFIGGAISLKSGGLILRRADVINDPAIPVRYSSIRVVGDMATVLIEDVTISGNNSEQPAMFISEVDDVVIRDSTLSENVGWIDKAIFCYANSSLVLDNVDIRNNHGEEQSIAELYAPQITIRNSRFESNSVIGGSLGFSGAVYTIGDSILVENSIFVNNAVDTTTKDAAAALLLLGTDMIVRNSTVSGNLGGFAALGITAMDSSPTTVRIEYSTVFENQFDSDNVFGGAGIYVYGHSASSITTLIATTVAYGNSDGTIASDLYTDVLGQYTTLVDFSALGVTDVVFSEPTPGSNLLGINPMLSELDDHGGNTLTHVPLSGSPLIDHIDSASPTCSAFPLDQRGFPRPVGGGCDIGAAERQPALFTDSLEDLP